jgi:hypothetical protein
MYIVERIEQLTLDEFVRPYEQESPFELVNGKRIPLVSPVAIHGWIIRTLFRVALTDIFVYSTE